jgi:hypothetical protein
MERDVVNAYNTAALTGNAFAGKMPKLKDLLRKLQPGQKQSRSEARAAFYQIAANLGKSVGKTRLIKTDG